jgi:amidase
VSQRWSAAASDALSKVDTTDLLRRLKTREVSFVEVTTAALSRARASQPVLNAVECWAEDAAISKAQQLDQRFKKTTADLVGFTGVPFFIKDNLDWAGFPTRHGSRAVADRPAARTDEVAQHLLDMGFIALGKSALPPFGFGCSTEFEDDRPPVHNPWALGHSAGGSSGGAAALVASGVVPIAHANDGGGSIRIPAALCGLVGLKYSRGRIRVQERAKSLPINIISDGVVTRSVRDTALFVAESEKLWMPPGIKPVGHVTGPSKKRLRIAMILDSLTAVPCAETRVVVESTAKLLESAGHQVELIPIPADPRFGQDFTLYWSLLAFGVEWMGPKIFGKGFDRSKLDPLTLGLSRKFQTNFWQVPFFLRRLRGSAAASKARSSSFDAAISPVVAAPAPEHGWLNPGVSFETLLARLQSYVGWTPLANAAGFPGISLPMGRSKDGRPIGVQLSAPFGEDARLIELAYELEMMSPWPQLVV